MSMFLAVLWVIAQVILWIIAVVLGLILLVILLLAIPARYTARFNYNQQLIYVVRVKWLFGLRQTVYTNTVARKRSKLAKALARKATVLANEILEGAETKTSSQASSETTSQTPPGEPPETPPEESENIFKQIASIRENLTESQVKPIIKHTFILLKNLYKVVKPKHVDVTGLVGLGCPYKTGLFFAGYEAAMGILGWRDKVRLSGDFDTEETVVKLKARLRGSFSPLRFYLAILRYALNKPVWEFLQK